MPMHWIFRAQMADRPFAEYAARNATPILEILRREFRNATRVLEVGSGTGQHAVAFASALDHLRWQTSDLDENHDGIQEWINHAQLDNVAPPLSMDVRVASVDAATYDAAFSSNTAHIMGIDAVERMFSLVGRALRERGVFCLYGPFSTTARSARRAMRTLTPACALATRSWVFGILRSWMSLPRRRGCNAVASTLCPPTIMWLSG